VYEAFQISFATTVPSATRPVKIGAWHLLKAPGPIPGEYQIGMYSFTLFIEILTDDPYEQSVALERMKYFIDRLWDVALYFVLVVFVVNLIRGVV
jgi:hypothetical protein